MKNYGWALYVAGLLGALTLDTIISVNAEIPRGLISSFLSDIFTESSIFSSISFSNAIFRTLLSVTGSLFVFALAMTVVNIKECARYFSLRLLPIIYLAAIFAYLNHYSPNRDEIIYATLSYFSLIFVITREHVFFFTQPWFCHTKKPLLISSFFALSVFILVHPLTISQGNILGTILMVNLWIYSVSEKNFWMGIAIHAAWNFVLPESATFHYALFLYSCFLAFGREEYPSIVAFESSLNVSPLLTKSLKLWRNFWCAPNRTIKFLLGRFHERRYVPTQEKNTK